MKIATLKGEIGARNGVLSRCRMGILHYACPGRSDHLIRLLPRTLSFLEDALLTPPAQSPTARLLQRLKGLQHEPPKPSEPGDLSSRTDITGSETESPQGNAPAPTLGRPSSTSTISHNTLGLNVRGIPEYPSSLTLVPGKLTGWRWPERDPVLVAFFTSTPPFSPQDRLRDLRQPIRQPTFHHVTKLYFFQIPSRFGSAQLTRRGRPGIKPAFNKMKS